MSSLVDRCSLVIALLALGAPSVGCGSTEAGPSSQPAYGGGAGSAAEGGAESTGGGVAGSGGSNVTAAGTGGSTEAGTGGAAACSLLRPPPGAVLIPPEPVVATTCTSTNAARPDACACDGSSCAGGEVCLRVFEPAPSGAGGPDISYNGCFAVCSGDEMCTAPEVCVENTLGVQVCARTPCRSASDCTSDTEPTCAPTFVAGHAGTFLRAGTQCVYAGACDPQSCLGCTGEDACHTCR
jgi:hypothetical protein